MIWTSIDTQFPPLAGAEKLFVIRNNYFSMISYIVNTAKTFLLTVSLSLMSSLCIASDSSAPVSLSDGVYNKAQAKSGKKLYKKHCLSCHEKGYFEPVFLTWQGEPTGTLYGLISAAMPESAPGSLDPDEYADIFAYILKEIGYPASTEPLDPESAAFSNIIIRPPG